jgi:predicted MFS family arabinose efflux permease
MNSSRVAVARREARLLSSTAPTPEPTPDLDWSRARRIIFIVAFIQFFVALEASMLFPLGPILSTALKFEPRHLGYLNGSFLFAASLSGLAGALCLDRFERRTALVAMLGALAICTALAGLAQDLKTLMICRFVAGLCGGPTMATGLALIADNVPVSRRGRAIAFVSAGSALAIIMGVPISVQMAEWFGWRENFFIIGGVGFALAVAAGVGLPRSIVAPGAALKARQIIAEFGEMLRRKSTPLALCNGALVMGTINMMAANLAPFFVYNLGFDKTHLGYLWMIGGFFGLIGAQSSGFLADRFGAVRMLWIVSMIGVATYFTMFVLSPPPFPVVVVFSVFMFCANGRIILLNVINSMVPPPGQRGRFLSLATAVNQAAAAIVIVGATQILGTAPTGELLHIRAVGVIAIAAAILSPLFASALRRRIKPN